VSLVVDRNTPGRYRFYHTCNFFSFKNSASPGFAERYLTFRIFHDMREKLLSSGAR
jgi:hypothetical protein